MKTSKWLCGLILMSAFAAIGFASMAQEPFLPGSQRISKEVATQIAWADIRENSGLTPAEMEDFSVRLAELGPEWQGRQYWSVVFESGLIGSQYWVQVESATAEIHYTDRAEFAEQYRKSLSMAALKAVAEEARREREKEMGPYPFWPYQDKAAFYAEYQALEARHLPGAGDMGEAEAIRIARAEMAKLLLAGDAYIDGFRLDTGFTAQWYWGETPRPTWIITLRAQAPSADGTYPVRHQAVVDAQTGEILLIAHSSVDGLLTMADAYRDTMYHNPDGGKYFHHDPDCPTVDAAFRPLQAYARGDVIADDSLLSLLPCIRCVSHIDGDWGTDWIWGGPIPVFSTEFVLYS